MQKLHLLDSHFGSIDEAIKLINQFYWHITVVEVDKGWLVKGGELHLFYTDNKESVDAFLYGMALSYSVLPEPMVKQFKEIMDLDDF